MAENRSRFPIYLHLAIGQVSAILGCFGILGYIIYGNNVPQIVTDVLPAKPLSFTIWCTILVGILFTYPLQLYPVIQIVEGYLFDGGRKKGRSKFQELLEASCEKDRLLNGESSQTYDSLNNSSTISSPRTLSSSIFPASVDDSEKEELLSDNSSVVESTPVYVDRGCRCSCKVRLLHSSSCLDQCLLLFYAVC